MNNRERLRYVSVLHMTGEDRQDHIQRLKERVIELGDMGRQFEATACDVAEFVPARIDLCKRTLAMLEDAQTPLVSVVSH